MSNLRVRGPIRTSLGVAVFSIFLSTSGANAEAAAPLTGAEIGARIYSRAEGEAVERKLDIKLVDRNGKIRQRRATVYRRMHEGMKQKAIFFEAPSSVKDMAFLTYDYEAESAEDLQWLYLPSLRKVRRIPASDRGDYFLGTDFTYDDIQDELKFDPTDYDFEFLERISKDGRVLHRIAGKPKNNDIAKALGYGGFRAIVDEEFWMPIEIDFVDLQQRPLKHISVSGVKAVEGIWTPTEITAENLQSGHMSVFTYSGVKYQEKLDDRVFAVNRLETGAPR